ncbi:MAG: hypothetical protein WC881_11340, partial [Elusimicrobiota bacterium]
MRPTDKNTARTDNGGFRRPDAWGLSLAACALALAGLYLAFPDKVYVFDGIMFASIIERAIDEWRQELFNRRHFLFNPAMLLLRDALSGLGLRISGYELIQRTNALLGAAGILVQYRLTLRLCGERRIAGLAALGLGLSLCYWSRATEGQVYMAMTAGALTSLWAALALVQDPRPRHALALAACLAAAILFHAANLALLPMAAAAFCMAYRRGPRAALWASAALAASAVAAPYIKVFGIYDAYSLRAFLGQATEFFSPHKGESAGRALLGRLLPDGVAAWPRLSIPIQEFAQSWVFLPGTIPALICGIAFCGLVLWAFWAGHRRPETKAGARLLLLTWGSFCALNFYWAGGAFFWGPPLAAGLGLAAAALAAGPRARNRTIQACALAAVLALGAWNLRAGILPQSRLENNAGYRCSIFVRDHTMASSWVIISGFGFPNAKVYLPYFAQRSREALEYYFLRDPKPQALAKLSAFIGRNVRYGIPMYLLSDVVEDPAARQAMRQAFGVSEQDVRTAFDPGRLILVAAQDPSLRIFLFVPRDQPEELFAALSYSVLTDSPGPRLQETAAALKEIAGGMTSAQRRRTLSVMQSSGYGAALLQAGLSPYMNPESVKKSEERIRRFQAWQQSADFHLRLGNL